MIRRACRRATITLLALPVLGCGGAFLGAAGGVNFGNINDHKNEITDPFGNVVFVNYSPDPRRYGQFGGLFQFGGGPLGVRLGLHYTKAGKIDVASVNGTALCFDGSNTPTPCPSDKDIFPNATTQYLIGNLDFLIRPWPPRERRLVVPYLLISPEARYRLRSSGISDNLTSELSELVVSLATGVGLQFDLRGMDVFGDDVHSFSMFVEGRYGIPLSPLLGKRSFFLGNNRVSIGSPYKETQWAIRFGFMFNLKPRS